MADLRRIEADPGDATQPRQGRVERRLCLRLAEVAEETEDQPGGQAVAVAGLVECAGDPGDHRVEGDAARRVALRIEEYLDMADIVGAGAGEIGGGEVVKVLLCDEDAHALIIDVEEILEVREGVGGEHVVDDGEGDGEGVRPEERRVGKECGRTGRSRGSTYN